MCLVLLEGKVICNICKSNNKYSSNIRRSIKYIIYLYILLLNLD